MQRDRLKKELSRLAVNSPEGISCYSKSDSSLNILSISINGPYDSPYEGGIFQLEADIPDRYPFEPPRIKFLTSVYHPNIDSNGLICLDLLKMPPKGTWKPTIHLENLFVAIQSLLLCPNPDDPLMPEIANEYKFNKDEFERKARDFTTQLAKKKRKRELE